MHRQVRGVSVWPAPALNAFKTRDGVQRNRLSSCCSERILPRLRRLRSRVYRARRAAAHTRSLPYVSRLRGDRSTPSAHPARPTEVQPRELRSACGSTSAKHQLVGIPCCFARGSRCAPKQMDHRGAQAPQMQHRTHEARQWILTGGCGCGAGDSGRRAAGGGRWVGGSARHRRELDVLPRRRCGGGPFTQRGNRAGGVARRGGTRHLDISGRGGGRGCGHIG